MFTNTFLVVGFTTEACEVDNIAGWVASTSFCAGVSQLSHFAGVRCSSVVRAFTHGAMGRRIDNSWGGPIKLFLVPASAPRLV